MTGLARASRNCKRQTRNRQVTETIAVEIPYGNQALLWINMIDVGNYVPIFVANLPH
jgi:hypothetical protein